MILNVKGVEVKVSDVDFEWLSSINLCLSRQPGGQIYIQHWKKGKCNYLHRMITKAPKGSYVDHINRDTLDNRRENLRIITHSDNLRNTTKRLSRSGYRGVYEERDGRKKKWRAEARVKGKAKYLGNFYDKVKAAKAWDHFMFINFPDVAQYNFPDDIV